MTTQAEARPVDCEHGRAAHLEDIGDGKFRSPVRHIYLVRSRKWFGLFTCCWGERTFSTSTKNGEKQALAAVLQWNAAREADESGGEP